LLLTNSVGPFGNNRANAEQWSLTEESRTFTMFEDSSSGANGEYTILPEMVNTSGFGIVMTVKNYGASSATAKVDAISLKITYEVPLKFTNVGNVDAPWRAIIEGPVSPTNQLIITRRASSQGGVRDNPEKDVKLKFEEAAILGAGITAEIDSRTRSLTIAGASYYGALVFSESQWFDLRSALLDGNNDLTFNTSGLVRLFAKSTFI
jgi:hypothetical protein